MRQTYKLGVRIIEKKVITVPKGILHSKEGSKKFTLHRYKPSIEASAIVQHYWFVRWDLLEDTPYEQHVVSHPNINLVFEKIMPVFME